MALVPFPVGNVIFSYAGAQPLTLAAWDKFTAQYLDKILVPAPNRVGYVSNSPGTNQNFASPKTLVAAAAGQPPVGYIAVVKQAFTVDSALFGAPAAVTLAPDTVALAGPAGETTTVFAETYAATNALTPSVAFAAGTGTVEFYVNGGWVALASAGQLAATTAFKIRVQHPNNLAFSATLTLTYA